MAISNIVQNQGLNPTQQQRLRGLGAVQAGASPSISAYAKANPIASTPPYKAPATTGLVNLSSSANPTGGSPGNTKTLAPDDVSNKYNTATGQLNPNYPGNSSSTNGLLTFPGLNSSLASTSLAGNPAAQNYTGQTAAYGAGNIPVGQEADSLAKYYQGQIQGVLPTLNEASGASTFGTSPVALGSQSALYNAATNRISGLTSAENVALQGTGQELTAQQQAANAASSAAGQANTGQGLVQSGLGTATGYAQPQLGSIGQVPFSPLNQSQGAVLGTTQPGGIQAAGNLLGQFAGAQAQGAAPGQTAASNINTAGTAQTSAANTAYNNATQAVSQATGQYTAATGVATNLTNTLGNWTQTGQLTNLNQAINKIASLTSSPQYSQFVAALVNTQAAYTAAFQQSGITPTQSTANAIQELNPNSSATAIVASLNQLSSDLHAATVVPAYQQQQIYGQQLGITQ